MRQIYKLVCYSVIKLWVCITLYLILNSKAAGDEEVIVAGWCKSLCHFSIIPCCSSQSLFFTVCQSHPPSFWSSNIGLDPFNKGIRHQNNLSDISHHHSFTEECQKVTVSSSYTSFTVNFSIYNIITKN